MKPSSFAHEADFVAPCSQLHKFSVRQLLESGFVEKVGKGRAAGYVRK